MANDMEYRLCPGTFFILVSNARKTMPSYDDRYRGVRSSLTEPALLLGLSRCVIPDLPEPLESERQSLKDITSDFKMCKGTGGSFFRFRDREVLKTFDDNVKQHYSRVLAEMIKCVDTCLDFRTSTKKDEYLVKALVEVIAQDSRIPEEQIFYVCEDGSTLTKEEICEASELCLQSFLLGIWHYVLTKVDNNDGIQTYSVWCPPKGGAPRTYEKSIGEDSCRQIRIRYCEQPAENDAATDEKPGVIDATEPETYSIETPEVRSVPEYSPVQPIFHFTQYGNNNTQIAHVENYIAGRKEKS